jgi:hypothetical protein
MRISDATANAAMTHIEILTVVRVIPPACLAAVFCSA